MKKNPPPDNPLLNILINIIIPVFILNKGGKYLDPQYTLIVALAFPIIYGAQDYIRRGHKNYVSLLGLLNIALTGGLALMNLSGAWFAVKEASLPLFLGLLVLGSAWTRNPAARMMFCNPQVMNMELIEKRLLELGKSLEFTWLLKRTTLWLSLSFFISAGLNFVLAVRIFKDIDPSLVAGEHSRILNEQIAQMTAMGFAVIALPLMIFSGILIYVFLKTLSKMIQQPIQSLLNG